MECAHSQPRSFLPINRISKVYFADKTDPSITLSAQSLTPLGFFAFRPISFSLRPFSSYARLGTGYFLCQEWDISITIKKKGKAKLYIFFRLLENFYCFLQNKNCLFYSHSRILHFGHYRSKGKWLLGLVDINSFDALIVEAKFRKAKPIERYIVFILFGYLCNEVRLQALG